jgi:hypothetical protein
MVIVILSGFLSLNMFLEFADDISDLLELGLLCFAIIEKFPDITRVLIREIELFS